MDYIRENYDPYKFTAVDCARKFDLSVGHVRRILRGDSWPGGFGNVGKKLLTLDKEVQIIQIWNEGRQYPQRHPKRISRRQLAKMYLVSEGAITYITSGKKGSIKSAVGG